MSYLYLLCTLAAGVAFGMESDLDRLGPCPDPAQSSPSLGGLPSTDDAIVNQPFALADLTNGLGCSLAQSWMLADDITPPAAQPLGIIQFWTLYSGSPATTWNFQCRNNALGPGSVVLWSADVINVSNLESGLQMSGYPIYISIATPTAGQLYFPVPGIKVWFCFQSQNGTGISYVCCAGQIWADQCYFSTNSGTGWSSSTAQWGMAYELFMVIGSPTALERDTWGSIKSTF
jgi:hypothetical protein